MRALRAIAPATTAAGLVLLAGTLYALGYRNQYHALLQHWGAAPFRTPFLDLHGVTSAIQCHRLGFDVYVQNPCDVFGRVHAYSPIWLWLAVLPITTAWDTALGLSLVLLFLAMLPLLPVAQTCWRTVVVTLATISSAVMFAMERANIDLLMFVMATLAVVLTRGGAWRRACGYSVVLLAGLLKFYPIVLLSLALREHLKAAVLIVGVALGVIAGWLVFDGNEIMRALGNVPIGQPLDGNVFGARDLPIGFAMLIGLPKSVVVGLQVALMVAMLAIAAVVARHVQLEALTKAEADFLLIGSVLMVGCFVMAQNVSYRAICFLFVLPGLMALGARWLALVWLIVLLMWSSAVRVGLGDLAETEVWLVQELVWWVVMTLLLAVLLRLSSSWPALSPRSTVSF